jgi:Ca2+/Na+ antiporter
VVARRPVAAVAAVVLVVEAFGVVLAQSFLGLVVDDQNMSLAGLEPEAMSLGTVLGGVLLGLYLLLCAFALLRTAIRDRGPGTFLRVVLIVAAVLHGLLGAVTMGLVGPGAFVFMMVVLALIVYALVAYSGDPREPEPGARGGEPEPLGT